MSRRVKIDGDTAIFPGDACVNCLRPAEHTIDVFRIKRSGFRQVSVPFCAECAALRKSKSRTRILFERIAAIVCLIVAWVVGVWVYGRVLSWGIVATERAWRWGALVGGLAILTLFGALYFVAELISLRFRTSDAKAAVQAVRIQDFDWETTTLEFGNETYADRFARANQANDKERQAREA